MRLCTVVRDRPSARARAAVEARAFSRKLASNRRSASSIVVLCLSVGIAPKYARHIGGLAMDFDGVRRQTPCIDCIPRTTPMKDVLLVGAGKIGSMIADFLASSGDYRVTVADRSAEALAKLETAAKVQTVTL